MLTGDVPCQSTPHKVWALLGKGKLLLSDRAVQCAPLSRRDQGFSAQWIFGNHRCCATACRRGPRHRRAKTGCRLRIVVWSDAVGSDGGPQGQMRGGKPAWRTPDRLMHTTQTAWERPRENIRKPGVRDRAGRKGDYCTACLGSRIIRRLRVQDRHSASRTTHRIPLALSPIRLIIDASDRPCLPACAVVSGRPVR
jgi:hypothetical protein